MRQLIVFFIVLKVINQKVETFYIRFIDKNIRKSIDIRNGCQWIQFKYEDNHRRKSKISFKQYFLKKIFPFLNNKTSKIVLCCRTWKIIDIKFWKIWLIHLWEMMPIKIIMFIHDMKSIFMY